MRKTGLAKAQRPVRIPDPVKPGLPISRDTTLPQSAGETSADQKSTPRIAVHLIQLGKNPVAELTGKDGHAHGQNLPSGVTGTQQLFCDTAGIHNPELAAHVLGQMSDALVAHGFSNDHERTICALVAMMEMRSGTLSETYLAIQMTAVHFAALKFLKDAAVQGQTPEGQDANVRRATKLLQVYKEQMEALAKIQGRTGQQRVTVEHVHVNAGGKAIVGAVTTGLKRSNGEGGE